MRPNAESRTIEVPKPVWPWTAEAESAGELGGAFADLGVLIPLEAALIAINGLNPTTTLVGVGIAYILAGRYFKIPMPVQPLKAFAAVAIASKVAPTTIAAGALWMALLVGLIGATGLAGTLARWTPVGVVRGIQLGLGLLLLKNGWEFIWDKPFLIGGQRETLDVANMVFPWGALLAVAGGAVLLLLLWRWPRVPAILVLLALGAGAGALAHPAGTLALPLGPAPWSAVLPTVSDFAVALPLLVLPQIPLTLANSVLATVDAAESYFGPQARRATPRAVSLSIALGNVWAGLAGGLPMCHGCGGLTAHYRLGARTPVATAILGTLLIGVGLIFGASALAARSLVPFSVYGLMLVYVGVEHLKLGWSAPDWTARSVAIVSAAGAMVFGGNLAIGALVGLATWGVARLARGRSARPRRGDTPNTGW